MAKQVSHEEVFTRFVEDFSNEEGVLKYEALDLDNALIQACIAFDATAKNEYPGTMGVGDRFRKLVRNNHDVITFFMLNGNIVKNQFKIESLTLDSFAYKVIRCGLLHEGQRPKHLRFLEPGEFPSFSQTEWCVPPTFIMGVLVAVIGAASNSGCHLPESHTATIAGRAFPLNDLWGHIDKVREAIYAGRDV